MVTFAVTMVKDEADIIAATVGHMVGQVDHVIVADNGSTDGTRDILHDLGVQVVDDPEVAYLQSAKMTRLAHLAGGAGAEWIVPFDADELWTSPDGRIGDVLAATGRSEGVAVVALWDHVPTDIDPPGLDPVKAMGWRWKQRAALHKVACRYRPNLVIEQGNHTARYGSGWPTPIEGLLQIRHFPYRSPQQFVRKARNGAAAYAASKLPETMGGHWRAYGRILAEEGEQALIDQVYRRWFHRHDPTVPTFVDGEQLPELVYDPAL